MLSKLENSDNTPPHFIVETMKINCVTCPRVMQFQKSEYNRVLSIILYCSVSLGWMAANHDLPKLGGPKLPPHLPLTYGRSRNNVGTRIKLMCVHIQLSTSQLCDLKLCHLTPLCLHFLPTQLRLITVPTSHSCAHPWKGQCFMQELLLLNYSLLPFLQNNKVIWREGKEGQVQQQQTGLRDLSI